MGRLHLFEWEDQAWLPHLWRNYLTDVLQFTFTRLAPRAPLVKELLGKLLISMHTDTIVDLCSGSSGPLLWFRQKLEEERGRPVFVLLTDKYPNLTAFQFLRENSGGRMSFRAEPIDATAVPEELAGVRTMFLSFHHFRPRLARGILEDAARKRTAIAVFEAAERNWKTLLLSPTFPLVVWGVTLLMRPVRLGRLFWTYLIPVVPLLAFWDGLVSCLRTYTTRELEEMTATVGEADYVWEVGYASVQGIPARISYLVGYPQQGATPSGQPSALPCC